MGSVNHSLYPTASFFNDSFRSWSSDSGTTMHTYRINAFGYGLLINEGTNPIMDEDD